MKRLPVENASTHLAALLDDMTDRLAERIIARLDDEVESLPRPALLDRAGCYNAGGNSDEDGSSSVRGA